MKEISHAQSSDRKNCTIDVSKHALSTYVGENTVVQDTAGPLGKQGAFIQRMQAAIDSQTLALETARGEKDYKLRLDKKVCPQCGSTQSYDEVQEKRKRCPNCRVNYGKASDTNITTFLLRLDEDEHKRQLERSPRRRGGGGGLHQGESGGGDVVVKKRFATQRRKFRKRRIVPHP
jgi:predicted Zn-ribbon and HTH transcriptional regulator